MKLSQWALALALAGILPGGMALAQQQSLRQSSPYQRTSTNYERYYAEEGEEGAEEEAAPTASGTCNNCNSGCDTCDDGCDSCEEDSCVAEPWRLIPFEPFGIKFSGWAAGGIAWNPDSPADRFNGPVTWIDRANEGGLQELWLTAVRAADTGGCGIAVGGRMDLQYGTNARFNMAAGLEDRWNKSQSFYALALPQFYGEVAVNDLSVKVGHFVTPCGFYTLGTWNNFFNTLPYTFQYGEPFTHTGILGNYKVSDSLALGAVMTRGWDNFDNFNPNLGAMGYAVVTGPNSGTFAYHGHWSNEPNFGPTQPDGAPGFSPRWIQTCVLNVPLSDTVQYIAQSDYGTQSRALADGRMAQWYGLNQYLYYNVNETVAWGINFEWFRDDDGFRVGGFLPTYTSNTAGGPTRLRGLPINRSGYDGSFYQVTMGPKISFTQNFIVRPNLRWDWYDGTANPGLLPYDDGSDSNQFMLATDMILLF